MNRCTCGSPDCTMCGLIGPNCRNPTSPSLPHHLEFVKSILKVLGDPNYAGLNRVLNAALLQAASGKGQERHNPQKLSFERQHIVDAGLELHSNHFALGQALKKIKESASLKPQQAVHELLGAINYIAAAIITLEMLFPLDITSTELYLTQADAEINKK